MNKRLCLLLTLLAVSAASISLHAQTAGTCRIATLHFDSLLYAMSDYQQAVAEGDTLKARLEAETAYNEQTFQRQFAEFLQGQKDFPASILLKRQRDLQDSMEKGIAFRKAADELLRDARAALEKPARTRLQNAIASVIASRGYDFIVNLDQPQAVFFDPNKAEDATPYVKALLQ